MLRLRKPSVLFAVIHILLMRVLKERCLDKSTPKYFAFGTVSRIWPCNI